MGSDVTGRVAFDLILGIMFRRVMHILFTGRVLSMGPDNRARDPTSLRIRANMIANLELFRHLASPSR